jgi:hypothetical protein
LRSKRKSFTLAMASGAVGSPVVDALGSAPAVGPDAVVPFAGAVGAGIVGDDADGALGLQQAPAISSPTR